MIKKTTIALSFLCVFFVSTAVLATDKVYSFGVVPQFEPRKLASIWSPILHALEERTGYRFKMVGSPKIPDFERSFLKGEFDFAYMNPYHALLAGEGPGYVPVVRDGGRSLYGILVTRTDSPVNDVKDLHNKTIAFPSPNALGAALLMRADLSREHGVAFQPLYVQTHSSVYLNVMLKKAAAGGGVMSTLKKQRPEIQEGLKVLYKTREISPHPVSAHPDVPQTVRDAVRDAFIALSKTEKGLQMLSKIPMSMPVAAELDEYTKLKDWGLDEFYVR